MFDIESIITWLQQLSPLGVYVALFVTTYIENVFPPSPSDVLMLFIATLIGIGTIDFLPALAIATAGSVLGFLTAFFLGRKFGRSLAKSNRFPFLTGSSMKKVDSWFDKYGYGVIIINRFLAGTRAVVSFVAGMSELDPLKTTLFCFLSALGWNALVIELGNLVGENWEQGQEILGKYGLVVSILLGTAALVAIGWWLYKKFRKKDSEDSQENSTSDTSDQADEKERGATQSTEQSEN